MRIRNVISFLWKSGLSIAPATLKSYASDSSSHIQNREIPVPVSLHDYKFGETVVRRTFLSTEKAQLFSYYCITESMY